MIALYRIVRYGVSHYTTLHCILLNCTIRHRATLCCTEFYDTVHYFAALPFVVLKCTITYITLQCTKLYGMELCGVISRNTLHYFVLYRIAWCGTLWSVPYGTSHCIAYIVLYWTVRHVTLHCIALHWYGTLHCIVLCEFVVSTLPVYYYHGASSFQMVKFTSDRGLDCRLFWI